MADLLERLKVALVDRYTIERELGSGGMATVYLAQDLKHDRNVALKVMRPELSAILGGERFLREVSIAAKLNHPHILALYDSGQAEEFLYYVMPHVEGESLREKLNREKQLSVDEAISITKEVGAALDYAHEQGVIHRDIKPENILMYQGEALVADFGIALAVSAAGGTRLTDTGLSLGTPEYMSPEQATGERELDARSDVYSLGAITYEMLVGEPPHIGNTVQAIIAKVVSAEPQPVSRVRHSVPSNVEAAVLCALAKTPADRFGSGGEFAEALMNPMFTGAVRAQAPSTPHAHGPWRRLAIAMTCIAAVEALLLLFASLRSDEKPLSRHSIRLAAGQELRGEFGTRIAISPDGTRFVYVGPSPTGGVQLWLREQDRLQATPLDGTEGGIRPFFAADGERLGFFVDGPELKVTSVTGGPPVTIADSGIIAEGGSWGPDEYLYVGSTGGGLVRVPATGGASPEPVTVMSQGETNHVQPKVLPNGKGVLFIVRYGGDLSSWSVAVADLRTGRHRVVTGGLWVGYAPTGYLVWIAPDGVLLAAPFDQSELELTGPAVPLPESVGIGQSIDPDLAFSQTGSLLYVSGGIVSALSDLVWVRRDGTAEPLQPDWAGVFNNVVLSPDGTRLAVSSLQDGQIHIWLRVLASGQASRLTFAGSFNFRPEWTPDGQEVTFVSDRGENFDLYVKRADGTGTARTLLDRDRGVEEADWSSDGRWLVFREGGGVSGGQRDIYGIQSGADSVPIQLATTEADELGPSLSPDGRWLAYSSSESGRNEIFVRPFPRAAEGKWQVSVSGGREPLWAHSGAELFYVNANDEMVVVPVATEPSFAPGTPRVLFSTVGYRHDGTHRAYDVTSDDQRFLMIRLVEGSADASELVLVQNWFEELKQRVGQRND
jgi:serine/threonine protein kinase/Tol biopolymer transport system component